VREVRGEEEDGCGGGRDGGGGAGGYNEVEIPNEVMGVPTRHSNILTSSSIFSLC
jgi:hypothetical protein